MTHNKTYHHWIKGCLANNRKDQEAVYKYFFPRLEKMCRRYTQDDDQIITIINNGMLNVFKKINKFSNEGSFEGWVRRIVFRSLSDYFRKENKYLKFLTFDLTDQNKPVSPNHELEYQDILNLINKLPSRTKEVFIMYAIEGYPHKDIADQLGISQGTSKWHVSEARKQLQQLLEKQNLMVKWNQYGA